MRLELDITIRQDKNEHHSLNLVPYPVLLQDNTYLIALDEQVEYQTRVR